MKHDEKALKPCPFCGKAMMLRGALWPSEGDTDAVIHAEPTDCPMYDFCDGTADGSIAEKWNRRALTSTTPPDVAGLIGELADEADLCRNETATDIADLLDRAATALRLSAGGGVPEGWKLVPVDPTPEMLGAFWRQKNCGTQEVGERGPHTDDCSAYRAMLAASPTVEVGR